MDRYAFTAQLTSMTPVGIVPEGLRMDVGFTGRLTDGDLAGATVTGVDYLLLRSDGIGVIDAREVATSEDGRTLALHAQGYIVPPFPVPELTTIAGPDFAWPDADIPLHGSAQIETADLRLAAANHTVYAFTGTVNLATGQLQIAAESIAARAGAAV